MALKLSGLAETGLSTAAVFVVVRQSDGQYWSATGSAFEAYNASNIANYAIAATEVGSTGRYTADDPADTTPKDVYLVKKAGASLAVSDLVSGLRFESERGSDKTGYALSAGGLDAVGIRLKKNAGFNGFSFAMVDASDAPVTGATVTGTVAIDGTAFASLTNAVSEIGGGAYKVNLAAADTNGNDLLFKFTASGCKTTWIKSVTQL